MILKLDEFWALKSILIEINHKYEYNQTESRKIPQKMSFDKLEQNINEMKNSFINLLLMRS